MLVEEFLREDKLEHGTKFFLTPQRPHHNHILLLKLSGQVLEFKSE